MMFATPSRAASTVLPPTPNSRWHCACRSRSVKNSTMGSGMLGLSSMPDVTALVASPSVAF